ncbi:hypothetical protein N0V90_008858 [Kalmusia sp. IMI 367209]|nr:hypothetical protein N0V90_008858 [Kalmusia sp. IMI 367209]
MTNSVAQGFSAYDTTEYKESKVFDEEINAKKDRHSYVPHEPTLFDAQKKLEAKVLRKVDWRLIPILGLLYSVAGLDRVNLSNARVAGMNTDLRFDIGDRYSIALLVFFITYFLFELPTTLLLRPLRPRYLLNGLAVSWGAVMLGMGFINDWRYIVVCRMLIGVFEAGYLPCCWFLVIDFPDRMLASNNLHGFTQDEIQVILDRIDRDRGDSQPDKLTRSKFLKHVANWELWAYGFMFLTCSAPIYAFAYFIQIILGTIVNSTAVVFLLCAPPYLFSIIWTVGCAWLADRSHLRMPWMVGNAAITFAGLLITAYSANSGARYFGVFLGVSGCNANLPTIIAFQSNNVRSDSRRSVANGVQLLFAAIGGIYASTTFMQKEYPTYRTGVWCAVATQILLIILCVVMFLHFRRKNKAADENGEIIQEDESFRYTF